MLVETEKVIVTDRIRKDFGNIEELAQDIKKNGLINPPVVTPEFELIAGERRLRACKSLGWQQIEVRIMSVRDYEHQLRMEISENENRKEFTFSERVDWARRIESVERIKAEIRMKNPMANLPEGGQKGLTRDVVAKASGFSSGKIYQQAKFIANNADSEIIKQLDEGEISINKAYQDTKAKLDAEIKRREQAEQRAKIAESKPPTVIEKEVIVDKTDYETIKRLQEELSRKDQDKTFLEKKLKIQQDDINEVNRIKKELSDLTQKREYIERQIESALTLSTLYVEIEHFLASKLAPIQYSRAITERRDSPVVIDNLSGIIGMVENWCNEMRQYLPKNNYIEAEVISYE